jgi:hypothetical protein
MNRIKEYASQRELVSTATTLERQREMTTFLQRIDELGPDISAGKWAKLFAICAEATKVTGRNIRIYKSTSGWTYDTTCHKTWRYEKW